VLHVNPTKGWRGGEGQTLLLCRGLAARGHEVLLVAAPNDHLLERAKAAGIRVRGIAIRGDGDLFGIGALGWTAAAFRPDIVHLHTSRAHGAGWLLSFVMPRLPLVVSRRVDFAPAHQGPARLKYTTRIARFIAVSDRVAEVLAESGVPRDRIRRVYSGVPPVQSAATNSTPESRASLRRELGIANGEIAVGTVGALAEHKDPLVLLEAFASLARRGGANRLVYVGDGELRGSIEREASRLGIADAVRITGFRDDPRACIGTFDVFVAASRLEGLNTSLLDAMAVGAPIVAARAGGMPELVRHEETGLLVEPSDPASLAAAIERIVTDRALAARLGQSAHARSAQFTDERMVEETLAVYDEVLSERGHSG
jgi:glycosyltransferase involved in cell wall biosynthesis